VHFFTNSSKLRKDESRFGGKSTSKGAARSSAGTVVRLTSVDTSTNSGEVPDESREDRSCAAFFNASWIRLIVSS